MNRQNIDSIIHEIYRSSHKIHLKHDIACRIIAKSLKANSVSILLYNGAESELVCRGKFIDPNKDRAEATPLNKTTAPNIIKAMQYVDIVEFFTMRHCSFDAEMFSEYLVNRCCDKTIRTKSKFSLIVPANN